MPALTGELFGSLIRAAILLQRLSLCALAEAGRTCCLALPLEGRPPHTLLFMDPCGPCVLTDTTTNPGRGTQWPASEAKRSVRPCGARTSAPWCQ